MDVQTAIVLIAGISVVIAAVNSLYSSRRAEAQRALTLKTQQHALAYARAYVDASVCCNNRNQYFEYLIGWTTFDSNKLVLGLSPKEIYRHQQ